MDIGAQWLGVTALVQLLDAHFDTNWYQARQRSDCITFKSWMKTALQKNSHPKAARQVMVKKAYFFLRLASSC